MVYSAPKFRDALQQLFQYHQEKTEELWRRRTIQTAIAPKRDCAIRSTQRVPSAALHEKKNLY
jgi:hypothetical protein